MNSIQTKRKIFTDDAINIRSTKTPLINTKSIEER